MSRQTRSSRLGFAAAAGAALLAALCVVAVAAARPTGHPTAVVKAAASHSCLVMTGSGDPAFTKNFNPYTATGLPSGTIVQGAFYEPLTITPLGGLPTQGWLARTYKWKRGGKTLVLALVRNAKWSDGKPLTS